MLFLMFCQNRSNMGPNRSGMPPDHSQTLLGIFCKKYAVWHTTTTIMKTSTGRKTDFLGNDKHKKDAYRYDSNFDGPMSHHSYVRGGGEATKCRSSPWRRMTMVRIFRIPTGRIWRKYSSSPEMRHRIGRLCVRLCAPQGVRCKSVNVIENVYKKL